jgi:hypothetical protein
MSSLAEVLCGWLEGVWGDEQLFGGLAVGETLDQLIADPSQAVRGASHRSRSSRTTGPPGARCCRGPRWRALSKVPGRTITFDPITYEQQRHAMLDVGLPEAVAEDSAEAVALMAEGGCHDVTDNVRSVLDRPASSFERFATAHAAAFSRRHPAALASPQPARKLRA